MKPITAIFVALLLPLTAMAEQPDSLESEVQDAVRAFNGAYASGAVETYFSYYASDATVYFYGARQDLAAYRKEWKDMVVAGGAVEKNELSDLKVQVLPGGEAAVVSYFVDYRLRTPDGKTSASLAYESDVWQKINGNWRIVNLHYSEIPDEE